jgi:ABC-type nitrate/sulfonate/bicarbonate transport system substrate-binding protein
MSTEPRPKKLLEQVDDAIRLMHYSLRAEESYANWTKRFIQSQQPKSVRRRYAARPVRCRDVARPCAPAQWRPTPEFSGV